MDRSSQNEHPPPAESLTNPRIALIGGAGFIGHHLALSLAQRGASVHVLDPLQVNNIAAHATATTGPQQGGLYRGMLDQRLLLLRQSGVTLHPVDARDAHGMRATLEELRPEVVVHLAGISHAARANVDPHSAFEHTLRTLETTLDVVRAWSPRFVYFSSSMVYGHFTEGEVTEETPCAPVGIYGALKYAGEKMVIAAGQVFDLPFTIVRPSALYGERCVSRRVVQVFLENALEGKELIVAGEGDERLDFTYIDDVVAGIGAMIEHPAAIGETFNVTYGSSRSIRDLIDLVATEFESVRVRYEPRDRLMPRRGTLSVDKARTLVGYSPQHPLETGLSRYARWYRTAACRPAPHAFAHEILVGQ